MNVNKIIIPPQLKGLNYTLEMYIKMYLTTSFILTASDNNSESIIKVFKKYGLEANVIGKIIKQKILKINDGKDIVDVIKF